MGDADNSLPPSKKRAAGRELSRDNPGLDDEEEVPGQEIGTFKKASEEVLANRRIVKVRRSQASSAPSAPSSNPFAAIRLVPPTDSAVAPAAPAATPAAPAATPATVNDAEEIGKAASEDVESPNSVNKKTEKAEDEEKEGASEVRKPEPTEAETPKVADSEAEKETEKNLLAGSGEKNTEAEKGTENEAKKETEKNLSEGNGVKNTEAEKDTENEAKKETENKDAATSVNSFQQLSSSQNAFTGLVGTGFSSSTFSFGSISKTDPPSFPSFSFGTNGSSALFGNTPGASLGEKSEGTKIPSMQEVHVETGEENEMAVFTADAALFEFLDGGWKERGKGELKVNVLTTETKKARLVMRARGNYRLILNASIFPDMKLTNMEKKGITFACLNSTGEGQNGLSTFALKFKDAAIVDEFRSVVTEHKGSSAAVPTMKTPENSPKASDE
ncbi:hypothetical protein L6452_33479 [Arctium lappa]|uniref:Uncharacterized protein n=1 Tax=Arctium lappa TaxID=4217 RepID=A0ACB8YGG7_ARCLA|nr:hypothetical protein L6452_33479 [Arctium lappa]